MVNLTRATGPAMCSERPQRAYLTIPQPYPLPCPSRASKPSLAPFAGPFFRSRTA